MKHHRTKIKNALSTEVPKWNDDNVWNTIENTLPAKKKNKIAYYFTTAVILLLLISGHAIFKQYNSSISKNHPNKITEIENTSKTVISKKESISKNNTNSILKDAKKNKIAHTDFSKQKIAITETNHKKNNYVPKNIIYSELTTKDTPETKNNAQINHNLKIISIQEANIKNVSDLVFLNKFIRNLEIPKRRFNISISGFDISKKAKLQIESNYTVDLIGGVYFTSRSLSSNSYQNWIKRKLKSETMLESTNYALSIQKYFKNNFSVAIGLGYTQTVERFVHKDSTISISKVYSDTAYVYPNGLYVGGMVNKTTTDYKTIKSPNRFKYLSIPISVNYNIHFSKSTVQIGGGISLDFWSHYSGYSLNLNNQTVHSSDQLNKLYKRPIGISSLFFNANYRLKLDESFSAIIGLRSSIDLKSSNTNKDINQKHTLYGGYLGLSYKLISIK